MNILNGPGRVLEIWELTLHSGPIASNGDEKFDMDEKPPVIFLCATKTEGRFEQIRNGKKDSAASYTVNINLVEWD
jgi:hypothetical protein